MRPLVDVAVGMLLRGVGGQRQFLFTSRPAGKVCAGQWEFPGGKVEAGESPHAALARELHEELGIIIGASHAWGQWQVDYPHACVRLLVRQVFDWQGELTMREGQQMAWQCLPLTVSPVLVGAWPLLRQLAQQWGYSGPLGPDEPAAVSGA